MLNVKFLELAQHELNDTFESFEYKKENLGYDFIQETLETLTLIKTYPEIWSKSSNRTQRCLIKGFPYGILYQYIDNTILVIAIVNLLKKPTHWATKSVSEYSTCRISILPDTLYLR